MNTGRIWLLAAAIGFASGCFNEDDGSTKDAAAYRMIESIAAFDDIQANITTNPAAAAEGLTKFIRTPVAASELLDRPAGASANERAIRLPHADVPECLDTFGETGCDGFTTNAECEAGAFTFTGEAERSCNPCEDVTGECSYTWDLDLGYADGDIDLQMNTTAEAPGVMVDADEITFGTTFEFKLTSGDFTRTGDLSVCSCGPVTITGSDDDLEVVNSGAVVKDLLDSGDDQRCALVTFDANGDVSVTDDCDCPADLDNSVCD